jgi:N-acetylmuramoyl-L-alanine amidase
MSIWKDKFIHINEYSRPSWKLLEVRKLVLHYTANPNADSDDHFYYFDKTIVAMKKYASAHIFSDKSKALCIIPLDEVAFHANDRTLLLPELKATAPFYKGGNANLTSIGVEMCLEKDGSFHPDMISRTEDIFVELCKRFKLDPTKDIVRHYDVTGKNCPAPWVKDKQKFIDFKNRVQTKLQSPLKSTVNPVPVKPVDKKSHTVVANDTFYSIAKKYGLTVSQLQLFNPRVKSDKLQIGDVIYLYSVPHPVVTPPKVEVKPTPQKVVKVEPVKQYLNLHPHVASWNHYDPNEAPIAKNANKNPLSPSKFGGLSYEIVGKGKEPDTYLIKTGQFGVQKIYAPRDKDSSITNKPLYK